MRRLFDRQLEKATDAAGKLDLSALDRLVTTAYEEAEQDRRRTDRSIELMVGELTAFQAGLEAEIEKRTSQLRQSQKKLRIQNTRFLTALENMSQGLAMYDRHHRLVICNRQFLDMYKLPHHYGRRGTPLLTILEARIAAGTSADIRPEDYIAERLATVTEAKSATVTHHLRDGRVLSITHRAMAEGGWVTMHRDITELHNMQAEIAHRAYHDALTGLPNRTLLYQKLVEALDGLATGGGFAVLCLDLDGFKPINDSMGHAAGDKLLIEVAHRLRAAVGEAGTVGRMGGDEFAVVHTEGTEQKALALAEALVEAIRRPFDIDGHAVLVGVSIGVALAPRDGTNADQLLKCGDLALYSIKRGRRGGFQLYSPALADAVSERNRLERDLRRALGNGEFELFYQPVLDLRREIISGFEALLRWHHPAKGLIQPAQFIPLAEELGLIVPIGEWVIREAFAEAVHWPEHTRIAVNVSSAQFEQANLVPVIVNALAATGLQSERVEIEITESLPLVNNPANLDTLHRIKALGARVALDDFGTGFSVLSYLLAFPFDKLKIDSSFVGARENAEGAHIILRTVADMAQRMGMVAAAEGIETAEQLRMVEGLGYGEAQGFLIAKPMPREEVRKLLNLADETLPQRPFEAPARGVAGRS